MVMLGVLRVMEKVGDEGGSAATGTVVLAIYAAVFVCTLVSWIAWGVRNKRGVVQWGEEPRAESFGQKITRMWKTASAQPTPPVADAPRKPNVDDEPADERQRTAG
jgi:hypothetical protein